MRDIKLYAKDAAGVYQRLELFGGDAVTITDSIKNAKDPAKVFTTFSQQFTVPASKVNNKIFKHYYNYGIENTFDARRKTDAYIEINSIPFKIGKLSLDGVDLRNNKPYAYRVTFYGGIVDLKDIFREDKLPSLTVGDASLDIDKPYNAANILTALTSADAADGTHVPLITSGQRLYYDSNGGSEQEQSGNLFYNAAVQQGVKHDQLKYAIKVTKIIDAIEAKYSTANGYAADLTFDPQSFFKAGDKTVFNELYMWCHRKKDRLEVLSGGNYNYAFTNVTGDDEGSLNGSGHYVVGGDVDYLTRTVDVDIRVDVGYEGARYDFLIIQNESVEYRFDGLTGNQDLSIELGDNFNTGDIIYFRFNTYEEPVRLTQDTGMTVVYLYETQGGDLTKTDNIVGFNVTLESAFKFNIAKNLPEMKVIDFLSSLFKMFNLVAFVQTNGSVQVKTLDEFFSSTETDITKYVDIEKSQVNVALPYREITFKYKDSNTLVARQHYQEIAEVDANGRGPFEWGAVEYTDVDPDTLSGGSYKIEPDFHHMKFERILDLYNNDDTNVQWGYFVDDNQETYLGSPLLFYSSATTPNTTLSFLGPTGTQTFGDGIVRMPSNFRLIDTTTSENLHFNPEISEFTREEGEETLFKQFYKKYIENLFSKRTRLIKVSCVLPVNILIQINLSDVIVLSGQKYRINSYSANLITGRTDFELINYYD